ncbi:MAG: quinolinate synthase NadA [Candidatus Cloacimonetes bacterium]|nr:quinolinate synthase NadA [Candidatus Cloacimonadota bacterium]
MPQLTDQVMVESIDKLKKEKQALILAHNYQILPVQHVADFIGDSLQLAQQAEKAHAAIILFCGVRFMAETAKLLNPDSRVLLSHADAGCPMADMITAEKLRQFKAEHPGAVVVCYVNSTVEVKAESDICCTSSNVIKIIKSIPKGKPILFVPDQNLGQYAAWKTRRKIITWNGYCNVHHHKITLRNIEEARRRWPGYTLIVHPETPPEVFRQADVIASTKGMADYAKNHDNLIIGTETGLVKQLQQLYPHKNIKALSQKAVCINMKRTSMRDVLLTLLEERNEIIIEPETARRALVSVQRMLDLS